MMGPSDCRASLLGLLSLALHCVFADAELKPYISGVADVNTECKTCPRSLCTNKVVYYQDGALNATCWTRGTKIVDGNIWLKTDDSCYVTQYDVSEYDGDYTTDLAYCGRASEERHITEEDATLLYKTECRICPDIDCDIAAYLPEDTDVTLTCWTDKGQMIIDDPYHMKTTNNCYVARKNLYSKPDITYLDYCGPIPLLEMEKHFNENGTSDINKRDPLPEPLPEDMSAKYLINVTVGEEYAYCRSCPKETCKSKKRYQFNQEVWLQCLAQTNGTWWSETTDFCYVKNSDFWQSPEGDFYKNPLCEYFEGDGEEGDD